MSFDDIVQILNAQGPAVIAAHVPAEAFATFFPGAEEMGQMMAYWERYTYLGPGGDEAIALARRVSTTSSTDFAAWAAQNMPVQK